MILKVSNLHVSVEGTPILKGIDLEVEPGAIHAVMGPNGSGKSTLASVLMGNPAYEITEGSILFKGNELVAGDDWTDEQIAEITPTQRGKAGMFLAFQYPEEIPGVTIVNFLRQALSNRTGVDLTVLELRLKVADTMRELGMDPSFADRYLNEGFSGGERKRNEVLQMAVLEPDLAIMDETDSGLDIDALRIVADGVNRLRSPERAFVVITHYQRLLEYITPDIVHILLDGKIVETGGPELAARVEGEGYDAYRAPRLEHEQPVTDLAHIRSDFPILDQKMNGHPLIYLDSAATSQKPAVVIDTVADFYRTANANVHRGAYTLSNDATDLYEGARATVAGFVNADVGEIAFNRGTTSALNQVAYGWGLYNLKPGDRILLTLMEHHANIVPWQLVSRHTGAELVYVPHTGDYALDLDAFSELLDERVKVVGLTAMSNVLGTINPVRRIADAAHEVGALVVVDAAQAVPHMAVDVKAMDADFLAFSGHKMLGPTGIGVLYGKAELLETMEPAEGGGEMISDVQLESSTWAAVPHKFEAGTPPIAEAIGLAAAVDYLQAIGMDDVRNHEIEITRYALDRLGAIDDLTIYGPADVTTRGGAVSFTLADIHPHDLATILDQRGVAIRAGHHCARPLARSLNTPATARASFYVYNVMSDVDALVDGLQEAREIFGVA